jgi:hypothetical protein
VRTLRAVRRERTAFVPRFHQSSARFESIARPASLFADRDDWPAPEDLDRVFDRDPPVRFVSFTPPPRRRGAPKTREDLYDAIIVRDRVVRTRPRSWHDYLNALVWGSFPRAKLALHERQHRAIEAWIPPGAKNLPNARTRELDALALIDEGGVLELASPDTTATLVFGHALFEGLVLDNRSMIARSVPLAVDALPESLEARIALADETLANALHDEARLVTPGELPRLRL